MTDHTHDASSSPETRILAALLLTIAGMVVSVLGGILASSLALLSDAGHMLADAAALGLALVAQRVASRPRTGLRTYGWRRAETLAAFVNAILLGVASVWVVIEAVERWQDPPDVKGGWMLAVAVFGLLVNLVAAAVLSGGTPTTRTRGPPSPTWPPTPPARSRPWSPPASSWASAGAGPTPSSRSVLAVMIFWGAWRLVVQTVDVLMEGTPKGLELPALEATIRGTPGVVRPSRPPRLDDQRRLRRRDRPRHPGRDPARHRRARRTSARGSTSATGSTTRPCRPSPRPRPASTSRSRLSPADGPDALADGRPRPVG